MEQSKLKAPKVLIRSFLFMYVNQFFWRAVVLFFPVFVKVLIIPPPRGGESRRNIYHCTLEKYKKVPQDDPHW